VVSGDKVVVVGFVVEGSNVEGSVVEGSDVVEGSNVVEGSFVEGSIVDGSVAGSSVVLELDWFIAARNLFKIFFVWQLPPHFGSTGHGGKLGNSVLHTISEQHVTLLGSGHLNGGASELTSIVVGSSSVVDVYMSSALFRK
jgi:hypothetical protein